MALTELTKVTGPGIHTLSNILSHNIKSSGIITATKFSGPLDSIGGNFAGVITATSANFTGNVSIGGTLTYEDVTNIDSVGIITARDGLKVLGGGANIVGVVTATGADINGDLDVDGHTNLDNVSIAGVVTATSFATDGGHMYITNAMPALYLTDTNNNPDWRIQNVNGTLSFIDATNSVHRIEINTVGNVSLSNDLDVDGHTNLDNVNIVGVATVNGNIIATGAVDAVAMTISASVPVLNFNDTDNNPDFRFLVNSNSFILEDTTNSQARLTVGATGNISINNDLDVDGHTNLDNVSIAGVSTFASNVIINKGSDVGNIIQITGADTTSEILEAGIVSGHVQLTASYAAGGNNSCGFIFRTRNGSAGTAERLRIASAGHLGVGDDNPDTRLSVKAASGTDVVGKFTSTDANAWIQFRDNTTTDTAVMVGANGDNLLFRAGSNTRWKIDSSGHFIPNTAGAVNIGSASAEIGDVYLADDKKLYLGSDQDLEVYHTGTDGYVKTTTGDLWLQSTADDIIIRAADNISIQAQGGEYCINGNGNGSVDLYYDGGTYSTPKLSTTATGITVDGEVAATQDYPNFRPTLDFNFAAEKKLDPRITYERTGPASFTDQFGKLIKVGDNAPRFDHDPTTRESKGLLIEESRTNQWLYSEDIFTYVTGGNLQETTLANTTATTDPTGGTNAVLEAATATGGAHSIYKNFTSGSNGDNHTFSVWVKAAGVDYARIYVDTVGGNLGGPGVTFSTGNTWNVSATGVATQVESSAVEYPNGWWRLSVSGSYSNRNDFYFHIDLEGGEGDISFTGNGSDGIYVWGAQAEAGAFPTSYIPTNGATVTRGADIVRIMDDEFKDIFGTEFKEFTIVADYDNSDTVDGSTQALIDFWGESTGYTDRIQIFKDSHSPYHIEVRGIGNNNGLFANGVTSASSKAATQRFATSWSVNYSTSNAANRKWAFSFSGEAVDVIGDLTGTDVPALTRLGIGNNPTRLDMSPGKLHFKRFMFYPKAVSDNQLRTLSS